MYLKTPIPLARDTLLPPQSTRITASKSVNQRREVKLEQKCDKFSLFNLFILIFRPFRRIFFFLSFLHSFFCPLSSIFLNIQFFTSISFLCFVLRKCPKLLTSHNRICSYSLLCVHFTSTRKLLFDKVHFVDHPFTTILIRPYLLSDSPYNLSSL